jgi:hypothetical protein
MINAYLLAQLGSSSQLIARQPESFPTAVSSSNSSSKIDIEIERKLGSLSPSPARSSYRSFLGRSFHRIGLSWSKNGQFIHRGHIIDEISKGGVTITINNYFTPPTEFEFVPPSSLNNCYPVKVGLN